MALDVFATPACSDELERMFSIASNTIRARRRTITEDTVQELICLQSWQKSGVVSLDKNLFTRAVSDGDNDDDFNNAIEQSLNVDNDEL